MYEQAGYWSDTEIPTLKPTLNLILKQWAGYRPYTIHRTFPFAFRLRLYVKRTGFCPLFSLMIISQDIANIIMKYMADS